MNNIPQVQIEQKQLERLAAMRELYSSAKVWHGWQIVFTVIIPVVLSTISLVNDKYAVQSTIFGLISFFVDAYFIDKNIKARKEKAAKIQEVFDCDVLGMPISKLRVINDIKVEEVLTHYGAHAKIPKNIELIHGWYPVEVAAVPLAIARIICQRANCRWDGALRGRYNSVLNIIAVIILIIIIIVAVFKEMNPIQVALILAGLVPFFQFIIKQYNDNRESIKRLDELYELLTQLWEKAIKDCASEEILLVESRRLQDEIFSHRSNNPLIFDFVYNKFRSDDESIMSISSQRMVDDALASNCI
jgi:hypothetical protein